MKKIILSLLLINILFAPCTFAASNPEILNKIENSLFGFEYAETMSDTGSQGLRKTFTVKLQT